MALVFCFFFNFVLYFYVSDEIFVFAVLGLVSSVLAKRLAGKKVFE